MQATGYPVFMEKLAATCATASESRVEIDGRIVTSRGPGTTIEFSITLIEQLFGKDKADEVSTILVCFFFVSVFYQPHFIHKQLLKTARDLDDWFLLEAA